MGQGCEFPRHDTAGRSVEHEIASKHLPVVSVDWVGGEGETENLSALRVGSSDFDAR